MLQVAPLQLRLSARECSMGTRSWVLRASKATSKGVADVNAVLIFILLLCIWDVRPMSGVGLPRSSALACLQVRLIMLLHRATPVWGRAPGQAYIMLLVTSHCCRWRLCRFVQPPNAASCAAGVQPRPAKPAELHMCISRVGSHGLSKSC